MLRDASKTVLAAVAIVTAVAMQTRPSSADQPALRGTTMTHSGNPGMSSGAPEMPLTYAEIAGWAEDDHLAAWKAFVASCGPVTSAAKAGNKGGATPASKALLAVCGTALQIARSGGGLTSLAARAFFESHFTPHRQSAEAQPDGLLTGYFEPLLPGSLTPTAVFATPVYRRPADLVNIVPEADRGAKAHALTHMQQTSAGTRPYLTRAEIDQGGLAGRNLELLYLRDSVDLFFMQVQGSGRIELPDGTKMRITYDGKNGHPYSSIGRLVVDSGMIAADKMSLKTLAAWLKSDRKRAQELMWQNRSYVFFRELSGSEAGSAMGVLKIPLIPGRSLAVDTSYHAIGSPIYVVSPTLKHAAPKDLGFSRLMIAHDVGSAIKGVQRGDIYFGSGEKAGRVAGITKHPGRFITLVPNAPGAMIAGSGP